MGGAIRCPVWNTSHMADFMIHVRGDATLTIWKRRNVYYKQDIVDVLAPK